MIDNAVTQRTVAASHLTHRSAWKRSTASMDRRRLIVITCIILVFGLLLAGLSLLEKQYHELREPVSQKQRSSSSTP